MKHEAQIQRYCQSMHTSVDGSSETTDALMEAVMIHDGEGCTRNSGEPSIVIFGLSRGFGRIFWLMIRNLHPHVKIRLIDLSFLCESMQRLPSPLLEYDDTYVSENILDALQER